MAGQAESQRGMTAESALSVLGLEGGGLPEDTAAVIAAGSRRVDLGYVREALRPYGYCYAAPTDLARGLRDRRVLTQAEVAIVWSLDGTRTARTVIDGATDQAATARLLWGLASGGALTLSVEPPPVSPAARRLAAVRGHIEARWRRLWGGNPTHYDVLEIDPNAMPEEIDRAMQLLSSSFGPERTAGLDLGELGGLVRPMWDQILYARQVLIANRHKYDAQLLAADPSIQGTRMRRKIDAGEAEAAFIRGQRALAAGEVFKAVSELAAAARRLPDEPDYETYAAWARVLADDNRGNGRGPAAQRERRAAEQALQGRRPRPRALYALGLICEAAGDLDAAREAHRAALACDSRLVAARQALERLSR